MVDSIVLETVGINRVSSSLTIPIINWKEEDIVYLVNRWFVAPKRWVRVPLSSSYNSVVECTFDKRKVDGSNPSRLRYVQWCNRLTFQSH